MAKLFFYLILIGICSSCNSFKSEPHPLTISRKIDNSRKMRLDGFYFSPNKTASRTAEVLFFYRNGVLHHMGSIETSEFFSTLRNNNFLSKVRRQRVSWGLYTVKSDSIEFERWYHGGGSEKLALTRKGIILNDSTFLIVKVVNSLTAEYDSTHELYHFKKFQPKPDSTNEFIK